MHELLTEPVSVSLSDHLFRPAQLDKFEQEGYLIVPGLAPAEMVQRMLSVTQDGVQRQVEPVEFEADLRYPGAPPSRDEEGGRTIRRLKQAHSRDFIFTQWLLFPPLADRLKQLLGPEVVCPLAHHNCIMTKEPRFSSETGWHQDIRYWSFQRPELVNVWLALGSERPENGCLRVIPGSHRLTYQREQFDEAVFFRDDLPANREILDRQISVTLNPGDVLFFHCRTLHAASRNQTQETKYSVVFTFRSEQNRPLPKSRSAASPEILLH